ncbi:unnamed protein product [marine sediment metagenome]|uniref:Uncharacterized protein n=1 Tax=marine sediment metagenome TaxID=412755 RepID=X1SZ13_9ZZZZ
MKWQPKDVIALVVIIGAIMLLAMGIDSLVGWTLLGIVGAYYGIDLTPWLKVGRNQKGKKEN